MFIKLVQATQYFNVELSALISDVANLTVWNGVCKKEQIK